MSWLAEQNATPAAAAIAAPGACAGWANASAAAAKRQRDLDRHQPTAPAPETVERRGRTDPVEHRRPKEFQRIGQANIGREPDQGERNAALRQPEPEGETGKRQRQTGKEAERAHHPEPPVGEQAGGRGVGRRGIRIGHACVPEGPRVGWQQGRPGRLPTLASAMIDAATEAKLPLQEAEEVTERPGEGLRGVIGGRSIQVTSRKKFAAQSPATVELLPPLAGGLECVVLIDGRYAATFRFRDEPRAEGKSFVRHLKPRHGFERVLLVSGDRETEVRYLAEKVGITEVYASQSPEQKLALVREETKRANSVFMGDGINDAPALTAATVGIAFGQGSDVTAEAAGAVIMDSSLQRVDELLHIGRRMRSIALQSAIGGMGLSMIGIFVAAAGYLPPVAGAITQEVIDVLAVLNALRAAMTPRMLSDYESRPQGDSRFGR